MGRRLVVEWFALCKLYAEGDKLYAEGNKLRAEGYKLFAEGDKLFAEGRMEFLDVIINSPDYGPETETQWTNEGCLVGKDTYTFE